MPGRSGCSNLAIVGGIGLAIVLAVFLVFLDRTARADFAVPSWWKIAVDISVVLTALATGGAAVAAAIAALSARDSVELTSRTAERELRAYINTVEANVAMYETDHPVMQVIFKNFGQTPAYGVTARIGGWIGRVSPKQPFPDGSANEKRSMGTVGPSSPFTARVTLSDPPFTKEMRDEIESGARGLFLFGRVEYTDAFGVCRYTNVRTVLPEGFSKDPDKSMSVCADGNDAN